MVIFLKTWLHILKYDKVTTIIECLDSNIPNQTACRLTNFYTANTTNPPWNDWSLLQVSQTLHPAWGASHWSFAASLWIIILCTCRNAYFAASGFEEELSFSRCHTLHTGTGLTRTACSPVCLLESSSAAGMTLIFFVGGITHAEVSALRFLASEEGKVLLLLTCSLWLLVFLSSLNQSILCLLLLFVCAKDL